ncbi:hypothetical protein AB0M44_40455 [Streptosporangium subroseum]|uniref:hypothetical protein n=1 Tax=Streptosporangium subroseum TaxID=106412 RepID=UPI0034422CFE
MRAGHSEVLATLGYVLIIMLLAACTPRDEELFHVVNGTQDTVIVKWKRDPEPFATWAPGEGMSSGIPANRCSSPPPDDTLIATSAETGQVYTYGPPICYGETWKIGS